MNPAWAMFWTAGVVAIIGLVTWSIGSEKREKLLVAPGDWADGELIRPKSTPLIRLGIGITLIAAGLFIAAAWIGVTP